MSIKILGVITEEKVEKIKVNKYIDDLSNKLYNSNIPHLIVEEDGDKIGIMLYDCMPSILTHNEENKEWEFLERSLEDGKEDSTLIRTYTIKDNNKEIEILDFVNIMLNVYSKGKGE